MSNRQNRRLERLKLEALKPHAHKFDLDHETDYARPGNNPPERAFHLLSCGFDLLMVMTDSAFPSLHRRARRRAGKWVREALLWNGAQAAGFMARAAPTLLVAMGGRMSDHGEDGPEAAVDPEYHLLLMRSVQDFYPKLPSHAARTGRLEALLDDCIAEFDVVEKRTPRQEVARGDQPANEYSLALLRGEDPQGDPDLVEVQRRYARDYFIHVASLGAMETSLRPSDVRKLSPKTIPFLDPNEPRLSKYRARALDAWVEGSRPYREYALMEFQNASLTATAEGMPPR